MKKFLSSLLAFAFIIPCAVALSGCGSKSSETKVMNVSLNPEIEFVLDSNDKVLTVNATNDEGNRIISLVSDENKTFLNLSADDAVDLFISVTKDNGYMISAKSENLDISISGNATELKDKVKKSAAETLNRLECEIGVKVEELKKSEIVQKVSEALKEYKKKDLEEMSQDELVTLLKQSREETKDFLNQEIKELYYDLRLDELKKVKYDQLLAIAESTANQALKAVVTNLQEFQTKFAEFKNEFKAKFLDPNSNYQKQLKEFIAKKEEVLQDRINGAKEIELQLKKAAAQTAKNTLNATKTAIINSLETMQVAIRTTANYLENKITGFITELDKVNVDTINNAVANAKTEFKANFLTEYQDYNISYWAKKAA